MQLTYPERQKTILLDQPDTDQLRQQILRYFQQTFKRYEDLFTCLNSEESYRVKANRLRHPLIFYYGHTACFFINKLVATKFLSNRINAEFESLFSVGVDEMSWDDLDEKNYQWPPLAEVQAYRDQVYATVTQLINTMPLSTPITQADPAWVVLMGIEHEHIHLETSSVLIRELPLELVQDQPNWQPCVESGVAPENRLLPVAKGQVSLAKSTATYGWDNEYGQASTQVAGFKASEFLVSHAEFTDFIQAGGYQTERFWDEEGWRWCQDSNATQPYFWRKRGDQFYLRLLTTEIPLPMDWPAEVNHYEADAFCRYLSEKRRTTIRLPSEAEWRLLAEQVDCHYPHWQQAPANIDLAHFASSCSVKKFKQGDFYDVIGNVWQWTNTPFRGFAGFEPHPAYEDFSLPTFDEKHFIFKGGCWISCGNEALPESRYAFRRHFFQCAGIRYIEAESMDEKDTYYESDPLLNQYLEFHFGEQYFGVKNFSVDVVEKIMEHLPERVSRKSCLDLGCAVGRASFELARHFDHVTGVDFSVRFIQAADRLQQTGEVQFDVPVEGQLVEHKRFQLSELGVKNQNITFAQGDACNLNAKLTGFDLILACNLIDRLYNPQEFLAEMKNRLAEQGILVICSPYTWLEEHTKPENWLGGYQDSNGNPVKTLAGLKQALLPDFELIAGPMAIPFVIRETARKFQHTLSEMTIWQLK